MQGLDSCTTQCADSGKRVARYLVVIMHSPALSSPSHELTRAASSGAASRGRYDSYSYGVTPAASLCTRTSYFLLVLVPVTHGVIASPVAGGQSQGRLRGRYCTVSCVTTY